MGTRNLTMVVLDGQTRVAQYCQWDGYPVGQGATVLKFLQNWNRETFIKNLRETKFIDEAHVNKLWEQMGAKNGMVTMDVADRMEKQYPQFERSLGAGVLKQIQFGKIKELQNEEAFAADSLFCEWAYVIDLDKNVLEVYKGFNKKPLKEGSRFSHLMETATSHDKEYYPIRLAKSYPLDNLPSQEQLNHLNK
jgi:hypothetical protein